MTITTRFAPTPSGLLHLGHAYAAHFASDLAVSNGGKFFLRMENIDQVRCKSEFEEAIYKDLDWLGISWEPDVLRQSDRMQIYQSALDKLKVLGMLYPCFCSRKKILKEIESITQAPHLNTKSPKKTRYPGSCKKLTKTESILQMQKGSKFVLRLDVEKAIRFCGPLIWHDLWKGPQIAQPEIFGDIVIARKDIPTSYHLAVTIDDHAQSITRVTRGNDLFEATHIHRLLQCLLGLETPCYIHHSLILDNGGRRFSKRDQSVTIRSLRETGKSLEQVLSIIKKFTAQNKKNNENLQL
uniref:Glutamyl-and glutaminyl-tRNA synthetases n=1 Tax=uncultured nuHF1 cluster bacterium HF0770_35I22 TaxID=723586 RepID=E7C7P1_9BACT|nr:glutamyl- and glutaminyl-tRNA synthetases [uncultured nuHF1 cluster bacterium HF0770_35I22]